MKKQQQQSPYLTETTSFAGDGIKPRMKVTFLLFSSTLSNIHSGSCGMSFALTYKIISIKDS